MISKLILAGALAQIVAGTPITMPDPAPEPVKITVVATAYTPRPEETDSTPFITAWGTRTREGIIATNILPFGTKVKINDKIYTVEDRMNRRYTNAKPARVDIAFMSLKDARKFGIQTLEMEILTDTVATQDEVAEKPADQKKG